MAMSSPSISNPSLVRVVDDWRAAGNGSVTLPSHMAFHVVVRELADWSILAKFMGASMRFTSVGKKLTDRLGRSLSGETFDIDGIELFGSWRAAYRQCVEHRAPCYEYLRCNTGDGMPELFERLTLPFADIQSGDIYVGGVVLFGDVRR